MSGFFNDNEIHVMVDLETLGLIPKAIILSIGACVINRDYEEFAQREHSFYQEFSLSGLNEYRQVTATTLTWWNEQEQKMPIGNVDLRSGLEYFCSWLGNTVPPDKELIIWANGVQSDIVWLESALDQAQTPVPWKYNAVRDYRTVSKLFSQVPKPEFVGQKHNALDDAINQARHLKAISRFVDDTFASAGQRL
jgi:hypothetical protein